MDIKEKKKKEQQESFAREMERISSFEDTQMPIEEFHRQEAERMMRPILKSEEMYILYIRDYKWEKGEIFGVAEGKAVQEIVPSGKGACKKRQEQKMLRGFEKRYQRFGERIGAGISAELEKGHAFRQELAIAGESKEDISFFTAFEEIGRSRQQIEAYRQGNLAARKPILKEITGRLVNMNVSPEWFTPEEMIKSSGELYHTIQEFKYFKRLYEDPVNRPFFDNLPEAEKVLVEERICKMAEVYEEMFRFQCRNNGVDADSGAVLDRETDAAYTAKEVVTATEFTERIRQRDAASRAAMMRGYRSRIEIEKRRTDTENQYTDSKWKDSLELISEHEEEYRKNKPLIDLMEQELYRLDAVKKTLFYDFRRLNGGMKSDIGLKEQYDQFTRVDNLRNSMQYLSFQEREKLILSTIQAVLENKKLEKTKNTKGETSAECLKEFQRKLKAPEKALSGKIDRMTKSWGQRRVEQTNNKKILKDDFYQPTYSNEQMRECMDLISVTTYGSLKQSAKGNGQQLHREQEEGQIYNLGDITTRKGIIEGLAVSRMVPNMETLKAILKVPEQEAMNILRKLGTGIQGEHASEQTDAIVREGIFEYKQLLYRYLKNLEQRYGKLLTQMHPHDILQRINLRELWLDMQLNQDMAQYMDNNKTGIDIFDDKNPEDQDFKALARYYIRALDYIKQYAIWQMQIDRGSEPAEIAAEFIETTHRDVRELESGVHEGPALKEGEIPCYAEAIRKKFANSENGLARAGYDRW